MKKFLSLVLALVLVLTMVACGEKQPTNDNQNDTPETVELTVFAAASLTESLTAIGEKYMAANENVKISFNCSPRSRKALPATCSFLQLPSR